MTKDEALRLALEALGSNRRTHHYCEDTWYSCPKHEDGCANDSEGDECNCGADKANAGIDQAITAIKAALEAKDEPVAWGMEKDGVILDVICPAEHEREEGSYTTPLYISSQRTWVGLTDEQILHFVDTHVGAPSMDYPLDNSDWINFARAIEAAHGIKETP